MRLCVDAGTGLPWPLDWLDSPIGVTDKRDSGTMSAVVNFGKYSRETFTDAVVIGMGGSVNSAKAFACMFSQSELETRLHTIDSTHPETLNALVRKLNFATTLFIVTTKSGTTFETLAIENFFRGQIKDPLPSSNFVAITDENSPIARNRQNEFLRVFPFQKGTEGRYSALSPSGILPLAILSEDTLDGLPESFADAVSSMRIRCKSEVLSENPAVKLGGLIAAAVVEGRNILRISCSSRLRGFGLWLEQLFAESLGKDGTGVIPIVKELDPQQSTRKAERTFATIRMSEEKGDTTRGTSEVESCLSEPNFIGAEMFKWQFATVLAGVSLGINPLNQPDVSLAKEYARKILSSSSEELPKCDAIPLNQALAMAVSKDCTYIALVGWLPESTAIDSAIAELRIAITLKTSLPTVWSYAPAYLHSTGQLFKGGPRRVGLIALRAKPLSDLYIPGLGKTFDDTAYAQMLGDIAVMREKGRFAVWSEIRGRLSEEIRKLADGLLSDSICNT